MGTCPNDGPLLVPLAVEEVVDEEEEKEEEEEEGGNCRGIAVLPGTNVVWVDELMLISSAKDGGANNCACDVG